MTVIYLSQLVIRVPTDMKALLPEGYRKDRLTKGECKKLKKMAEEVRWQATWLREVVLPQLHAASAKKLKRVTVMWKGVALRLSCLPEDIEKLAKAAQSLWDRASNWLLIVFNGQIAASRAV